MWATNHASSAPAMPNQPHQRRYGGRIAATDELAVHANADSYTVDGAGTVTRLPSWPRGALVSLDFATAARFMHSARLLMPSGVSKTFAAGDYAVMLSLGDGAWRCVAVLAAMPNIMNANGLEPFMEVYTDDGVTQSNITATSYSINGGGTFHVNHANGTHQSPSRSLAGDITGGIGSRPYSGAAFLISSPASIHWVAAEDINPATGYGSYLRFLTTPIGSTTRQERVIITHDGTLWAHDTGTFDPKVSAQTKPVSDMLILASGGAGAASIGVVSYGAGAGFRGGVATGTPAAPGATGYDVVLSFFGGFGHDGSTWASGSTGVIFIKSAEAFTPTAKGTYLSVEVTPIGSTTRLEAMRVTGNGNVGVGTELPSKKFVVSDNGDVGLEISPNDASTPGAVRVLSYDRDAAAFVPMHVEASKVYFDCPVQVKSYAVSALPSAGSSGTGALIFVSDETGGAVLAFSDGSNWRRVTDRTIVS